MCTGKPPVKFSGIPTFAPEHFARVSQVDTLKRKQFVKGMEAGPGGAIQIFREVGGGMEASSWAWWACCGSGARAASRGEYHVRVRRQPLPYTEIGWIENKPDELDARSLDLARDTLRVEDVRGNKLLLFINQWNVNWALERNPKLRLSEFGSSMV